MYVLTQKAISLLKEDEELRRKVAAVMGKSLNSINRYVNGVNTRIATHDAAINLILDKSGLTTKDLIKLDDVL
jgi:hypothetical protein